MLFNLVPVLAELFRLFDDRAVARFKLLRCSLSKVLEFIILPSLILYLVERGSSRIRALHILISSYYITDNIHLLLLSIVDIRGCHPRLSRHA